jgi:4-hydroxythreonine-4-phosphate dehydrogenase
VKTQALNPPTLALTAGEPAGIGPDLCVMLAQRALGSRIAVIADRDLLRDRAKTLGLPLKLANFTSGCGLPPPGALLVRHVPLVRKVRAGELDAANSAYVLRTLEIAATGCIDGEFDAMVTGPVHKGVINDAGIPFTGHTEYLAQVTGGEPVMMLQGGGLRVALATIHVALKEVPAALTGESLTSVLRILERDLKTKFAIAKPRILIAGLNPHAGESGHIGTEEIEVISPVLDALRAEGMQLTGPLPADTIFNPERLRTADCVLAMYHDQGLPVIKFASFGEGVNVTLGLPIIRTSVDHGTALELAGTGRASIGSLLAAIDAAVEMAQVTRQAPSRHLA